MDRGVLTATATAAAAHYFIAPIHEVSTVKAVQAFFTADTVLFAVILTSSQQLTHSLARFSILNLIFLLVFISLTLVRRLYFSPLSCFPGPRLAVLSNIYLANECRAGRASRTVSELHRKYNSDFVRIGPSELSIRNVEAVEAIFRGKYPRGTFYEVGALNKELNLNTQRDYQLHTPWRRIWFV